ncbi:MAG: hypothetical protein ACK421_02790 [Pseudanabaenaceae cyanobacterium]
MIFLNYLFTSDSEEVKKLYAQAAMEIFPLADADLANLLSCLIDGLVINSIYDARIGAILGEMLAVYWQHKQRQGEVQT